MPATLAAQLRRAVGDRIPTGQDESSAFFTNVDIQDLLEETNNNLNLAALLGWETKLAEYAKFVDIDESGSIRKLSQLYKNALLMVKHYADRNNLDGDAIVGRVVGRSVNLWADDCGDRVMATAGTFRARGYPAEGVQAT